MKIQQMTWKGILNAWRYGVIAQIASRTWGTISCLSPIGFQTWVRYDVYTHEDELKLESAQVSLRKNSWIINEKWRA